MRVVDGTSEERDLAALAIDDVGRLDASRLESGGVSHQLEGRSRLVYIAHRVIAQETRGGMAKIVGIVCRTNRKRQNLAGVRVLNYHRAVQGMVFLHRMIQRALR